MPPDAAMWRQGRLWSQQDELLATQIEQADMWSRIGLVAQGAKKNKLPDPPEIRHPDRPGMKPVERKVVRVGDYLNRKQRDAAKKGR